MRPKRQDRFGNGAELMGAGTLEMKLDDVLGQNSTVPEAIR